MMMIIIIIIIIIIIVVVVDIMLNDITILQSIPAKFWVCYVY